MKRNDSQDRGAPKDFSGWGSRFGNLWNLFWFTPRSTQQIGWLRTAAGILGFLWIASFVIQWPTLAGPHGIVSLDAVHQVMANGEPGQAVPGMSLFFVIRSQPAIWVIHGVSLIVMSLLVAGVATHVTTPLALLVVWNYAHRVPMLTGLFGPLLSMLLLYLSLAPRSGSVWSLFFRNRDERTVASSWRANASIRMIQVHLCLLSAITGLSKLGSPVWTQGAAVSNLAGESNSMIPWVNSFPSPFVALITYVWMGFDLFWPVFIWSNRCRPYVIRFSFVVWCVMILLTGQVGYGTLWLIALWAWP